MASIHPTAIVDPKAELADSVSVGAFTTIGPNVRIGEGTSIGAHCVIEGVTTIGRDNKIYQLASVGADPQDKKYKGEPTQLIIGDRNTIREFTTFNTGTVQDKGVTEVGHDNWIMAYVHVAHDCVIGDHNVIANSVQFAGHVTVGNFTLIGGISGIPSSCASATSPCWASRRACRKTCRLLWWPPATRPKRRTCTRKDRVAVAIRPSACPTSRPCTSCSTARA